MAETRKLTDLNGQSFYPLTNTESVIGSDGESIDAILGQVPINTQAITEESERAKASEGSISSALSGEVARATQRENAIEQRLGNYILSSEKGSNNGVATLNGGRKVWNDQLGFAYRGEWQTSQDIDATDIEPGMYFLKGNVSWAEVLSGDSANGVLVQYPDNYHTQQLIVGRSANHPSGEQVETYTRRYLSGAKRWTAWSKGGGGMAEVPPTILPNPMVKTSEGVYEFTAEVGKLYDLEKWDDLADVLRVHLPTPSDPSRGWKIGFIVQDNMSEASWTDSDIFFMYGDSKIINVQQLFDKSTQVGWQHGPWKHSLPQMILFKWVGKLWVVESFTNDVLYPFTYSLVREDDYYLVMKGSNGANYRVVCPQYSMMSDTEANAGTSSKTRVITASVLKGAIKKHTSDKANTKDVYTKTEADERFQPKGNYLTQHQDISGKEDKVSVVNVASGTESVNAQVGKYYSIASNVGTLAVTLPTITTTNKLQSLMLSFETGDSPNITIAAEADITYFEDYYIQPNTKYEINIIWNGTKWIVAYGVIV